MHRVAVRRTDMLPDMLDSPACAIELNAREPHSFQSKPVRFRGRNQRSRRLRRDRCDDSSHYEAESQQQTALEHGFTRSIVCQRKVDGLVL